MNTLLLSVSTWDLVLDSAGNIAMALAPYALAQDVASTIRLFLGELYYQTDKGVPYFQNILGKLPPITYFKEQLQIAALSVPNVVSATVTITSFRNRTITGQVTFKDNTGISGSVSLSPAAIDPGTLGGMWTADSTIVTADSSVFTADG